MFDILDYSIVTGKRLKVNIRLMCVLIHSALWQLCWAAHGLVCGLRLNLGLTLRILQITTLHV